MINAIIFIFGGSLVYMGLLKFTSGNHVLEEENNRRRFLSYKNKKYRKKQKTHAW